MPIQYGETAQNIQYAQPSTRRNRHRATFTETIERGRTRWFFAGTSFVVYPDGTFSDDCIYQK